MLVSHDWRAASQTPQLYAYHLSRCPSFSINNNVITGPFDGDSLPQLRKQFIQEVKRNLFQVFLRPRRTVVKLISTTTSSAAAFPGGEAFDFTFSPNGHWVLALSSSRIYVINTVSPKVSVQRELKVLRRPVSAAILDDGSILAVLSSDHRVNVYNLSNLKLSHIRAISLDNPPHTIALSPKGDVLAAAYDGGIEVHSLIGDALSTDRRGVKCDSVDSLVFSNDGTMLFGTTQSGKNPNTVVLSAPFYNETNHELPAAYRLSHMWTSQILFPNSSRDCSHAALLPHHAEGDANWIFTYDRVFETFRAVRTDDLRNGTTYFIGPKNPNRAGPRSTRKKLIPCTLPATSDRGELVAAGFLGREVWLYGVPENLDTSTVIQTDDASSQNISMSRSSTNSSATKSLRSPPKSLTSGEAAELRRLPQWQVLVDRHRNVFAKGRRVAEIPGVTGMRWVSRKHEGPESRSIAQRLVIAAPGGVSPPSDIDPDEFATVDGGRLVILDFDRNTTDGKSEEITFEVGDIPPELLEEEDIDMDTEVAIVRQRTVRQRSGLLGMSIADVLASAPDLPTQILPEDPSSESVTSADARRSSIPHTNPNDRSLAVNDSPSDGLSLEEASAVFDGPYSHTHPRSRTSLYRSATAVAANRQRNPPRIISEGRVEYRRADGRGELPHESDADNWVPPPPPYTPDPDRPLPEYLRRTLMQMRPEPTRRASDDSERLRRATTTIERSTQYSSSRRMSSLPERPGVSRSSSSSVTPSQVLQIEEAFSASRLPTDGTISPLSATRFSGNRVLSELSSASPSSSPVTPSRRPVSAHAGRYTGSSQRANAARLTSPISPIPEPYTPSRRRHGHSLSLPSSPVSIESPVTNLTLSGANLQQRLEYPLPPAPSRSETEPFVSPSSTNHQNSSTTPSQAVQDIEFSAPGMPSAQQLENLHNRYRRSPSPQLNHHLPPGVPALTGYNASAPPRGALGAAGSPISPIAERRRLSISQRNSFAVSSPALLRPTPRRLDTIQSIASTISRSRSRSREIDIARRLTNRRSRSLGPATRMVRGEARRGWFGIRKPRKAKADKILGGSVRNPVDIVWTEAESKNIKESKCAIM